MVTGQGPLALHMPHFSMVGTQFTKEVFSYLYFRKGPLLQRSYHVPAQEFPSWWTPSLDTAQGGV